jgi:hypothetical protein
MESTQGSYVDIAPACLREPPVGPTLPALSPWLPDFRQHGDILLDSVFSSLGHWGPPGCPTLTALCLLSQKPLPC